MNRRSFLKTAAGGVALASARPLAALAPMDPPRREYTGPNVIIARFGGGSRRRETIDAKHTYSPFFIHEFAKRGTLFTSMEISQLEGVETGHGQGTLNLLTGRYDKYKDIDGKFLGERFEAKIPTVFERLRKAFDVPEHQTLIVNGEDRVDEEFYTFSNHHLFGVQYRSNVLSLFRFKTYLLRRQLERSDLSDKERVEKSKELAKMESMDYRTKGSPTFSPELEAFWERWRRHYGASGLVNPRGDRTLTELATRAIRELRPKLMMINYNDCDYVHWGNMAHYTRAVSIMDDGLKRLVETVEADEAYRDNTVFVVAPDCGRDDNPFMSIPCQHHSNTKSAHEIYAALVGPGIARGIVVNDATDQIDVAPTVARLMGVETTFAEGTPLEQAMT